VSAGTELLVAGCVAAGGALGAPARYLIDMTVSSRVTSSFPVGTWAINVTGSLLLGILTGLTLRSTVPAEATAFVATGFCGAFTTFSTWTFETVELFEQGAYLQAGLNVLGSLAAGLLAAAGGIALGLLL
jgi:CrcB protein